MQVSNKVFVVTGGGNGIGREVVLTLLSGGARVAAVDVRADGLAETTRLAADAADRISSHLVDITERAAVEALPEQVLAAHGQIDGLVNVAGIIQRFVRFADLPYEDIDQVLAVNFWGVVHTMKAFLPHLTARAQACVVNVSSMGGFVPVPGQTAYGASKAAIKALTEGLYAELLGSSVAVTVVFPGGVATDIVHNSGAAIPGRRTDPSRASITTAADAAGQIVGGIRKGSYRVVIGRDARLLDRFSRLLPLLATRTVAKRMASLLSG